MNKAITDGVVLMPPPFINGLGDWSREDGTPGSDTYQGAIDAAVVPADQDFGGCLELVKTESTQRLRWMGQTPIEPGCYLRISARVKAVTGNLPSVRVAGYAARANGTNVGGITQIGPSATLTTYGEIVTVSAIVGTGARGGVDMVWGTEPVYGHFGLDLTGPTGGVVRIDDIQIEDVTGAFLRSMLDWVDVRDYGAIGDGVTDDSAAFFNADSAAAGRQVLVPAGTYRLGSSFTFNSEVRFEGTVTMADADRLILKRNFDLNGYIDAFGDEVQAFKKAFQALLNFSDHESLDLNGRRIEIDAPLDMQAIVANKTVFETRRVIRNGQFNLVAGSGWDTEVRTGAAIYDTNNPTRLTNVANIANIPVGSLVEGTGVGREVYVKAKNVGAAEITLSQKLWGAPTNQVYTFRRFKYAFDFSGFSKLSKMTLTDLEFQCAGFGSAIMLCPDGATFHVKDSFITRPKDRGITSIGRGCQDLQIDRCHFDSDEQSIPANQRTSICFNINANDSKIRQNRFQRFLHTGIIYGNSHLISGNHWFHGDGIPGSVRPAGIVFTLPNITSVVADNYIDNSFVEWTNEHDSDPDFANEFSFGGLSLTGNVFFCGDAPVWFSWIVVKPFGTGHFLQGLNVSGNVFKSINGQINRVERVDTTIADLDHSRARNVTFEGNSFNNILNTTINPVTLEFNQASNASTWTLNVSGYLPFEGYARTVSAVTASGNIKNVANTNVYHFPAAITNVGGDQNLIQLIWPESVRGKVQVTARSDRPV